MASFQLKLSGDQVKAVDALLTRLRLEDRSTLNRYDLLAPIWDAAVTATLKAENARLDAVQDAKAAAAKAAEGEAAEVNPGAADEGAKTQGATA